MSFDFASLSQTTSQSEAHIRFRQRLSGSTRSLLVSDAVDDLWVLKFAKRDQSTNRLANELIGAHLCDVLHLPTPEAKALHLSIDFLEQHEQWFERGTKSTIPRPGLQFASRYLPQANDKVMVQGLPNTLTSCITNVSDCLGIFVFDVWAMHNDSRQAVFDIAASGLNATFIDNGEILGGEHWSVTVPRIDAHIVRRAILNLANLTEQINSWITRLEAALPSALTFALEQLPPTWYHANIEALRGKLFRSLDELPRAVVSAIYTLHRRVQAVNATSDNTSGSRSIGMLQPDGNTHFYNLTRSM